VVKGNFREVLFYLIYVIEIQLPPLRERKGDIPVLSHYFLDKLSKDTTKKITGFSSKALQKLMLHSWPGNVRELKNMVQRLLILGTDENIDINELDLARGKVTSLADEQNFIPDFDMPLREAREQFEKEYLQHKLTAAGGSVSKVAEAVGMERTHLYRKLKSLGIAIKNQDSK